MRNSIIAVLITFVFIATLALPLAAVASEEAETFDQAVSAPAEAYAEPEPDPDPITEQEQAVHDEGPAEDAPTAEFPAEETSEGPAYDALEYAAPEDDTEDVGEPGDYNSISHIEFGSAVVGWEDVSYDYDRQENMTAVYAFLTEDMELTPAAACGILANMAAESDFNPCDANSTLTSYGLCQWSGARVTELKRYCEWYGYDYHTLEGQLAFLRYELTGPRQYILDYFTALTNDQAGAYEAGRYFCYHYEVVADRPNEAWERGCSAAEDFLPELNTGDDYAEEAAVMAEASQEDVPFFAMAAQTVRQQLGSMEAEAAQENTSFFATAAQAVRQQLDALETETAQENTPFFAMAAQAVRQQLDALEAETAQENTPFFATAAQTVRQQLDALEAEAEEEISSEEETSNEEESFTLEEDPFVIDPSIGTGYFIHPVPCESVTSNYGWRIHPIYNIWKFHAGMDIGADEGQPIRAADNGTVIISGYDSGYGNYVVIDHNDGYQTLYAHQSELAVTAGDQVSQGDLIGYVGSTGLATGPHLHYEVWSEYETVEPLDFVANASIWNPYS